MRSSKKSIVIGIVILSINVFLLLIYVQKQLKATIQFMDSLLRMVF